MRDHQFAIKQRLASLLKRRSDDGRHIHRKIHAVGWYTDDESYDATLDREIARMRAQVAVHKLIARSSGVTA